MEEEILEPEPEHTEDIGSKTSIEECID